MKGLQLCYHTNPSMRVKSFSCGGPSSYEAILWANYFFSNLAMSLRITLVFPHCSCLDGDNPRYIGMVLVLPMAYDGKPPPKQVIYLFLNVIFI